MVQIFDARISRLGNNYSMFGEIFNFRIRQTMYPTLHALQFDPIYFSNSGNHLQGNDPRMNNTGNARKKNSFLKNIVRIDFSRRFLLSSEFLHIVRIKCSSPVLLKV